MSEVEYHLKGDAGLIQQNEPSNGNAVVFLPCNILI